MVESWLIEPVADLPPCGPDLERADDPAFVDYYFEAESRLPERYFTPGMAADGGDDRLFDPRSVDLRREIEQITDLLKRSRDLRLLSLMARFQILAGRLGDFTGTLETMAELMARYPGDLHPRVAEGASGQRAALESLAQHSCVVMPLMHLPILPNSNATLRRHLAATGRVVPRASENDLDSADVVAALRSPANRKQVDGGHALLSRAAAALTRMRALAAAHPDASFHPDLSASLTAIADIQAMIAEACPDLRPWSADDLPAPAVVANDVGATPEAAYPADAPVPLSVAAISSRAAAKSALLAAEAWLARHEPSSPVLLLVVQARLLVGAPLIEALETLLPGQAGQAVLNVGQGSGFHLPMERLKVLTQTGLEQHGGDDQPPEPAPEILSREALAGVLAGVEQFYRRQESASPIPLLLAKGREMMNKSFDAITAELIAPAKTDGT